MAACLLSPGSTMVLQFDSPLQDWVLCHHVSACLEGQEMAIHENGATKARSRLFDAAHDFVDGETATSFGLSRYNDNRSHQDRDFLLD